MNILVYQDISKRHIQKANVINTINIAKGFIKNNINVFFFSKKELLFFFEDKINNVNFIDDLSNLDMFNVIYCRNLEFPLELIKKNYKGYIIIESHDIDLIPEIKLLRNHDKLIFTSISPLIIEKYNIRKSLLFPCSIDFDYFSNKELFNEKLFSSTDFNITYCGHLYDYKGIPIIIQAAKFLNKFKFHLVGGKNEDIERHKKIATDNVIFYGHKNYNDVPNYLYSSDLLLIPYSKKGNKFSPSSITSPIKLFEYLSTKIPVLCSDIIGIKNWVNDDEVTFFEADNLDDFIHKINNIKINSKSNEIIEKINNGFIKASKFTTKNKCYELLKLCK